MIGIIIILIPLIIYVIGAFSVKKKKLQHPDDFFVAYKRVGETAFSSSSISYAFQVSTIYPFLLWGASEFYFIPLVNTICWGIGILLFYLSYNRYKKFIGKDVTLHGFLGETYGKYVRVVASYLTIVAFLGFTISETYFGSKVLLSIIDSKTVFYFVIIISIFFVYSYISYGGQVSSLRTDQLQLIISYIGVFGLVLYLTYLIFKNDIKISPVLSIGLLVFSLYALAILFFRKFEFIKLNEKDNKSDIFINKLLNTLVVLFFIAISTTSLYVFFVSESKIIISKNTLFNIDGFGYSGLLSLIILPLCFQFVDLSNWQRLLSVKDDNKNSINIVNNKIRKGLLNYALESPFTWLIFVFFHYDIILRIY